MIIEYFLDHISSYERKILVKFVCNVVNNIDFLSCDFSPAELRIFKKCVKKFVCLLESRCRKEL